MIRRFLRAAPKLFIAVAVIVASITILVIWKIRQAKRSFFNGLFAPAEQVKRREPVIEGREGRLLLVDNDLYDLDSGAVLATKWLEKNMPEKLFFDASAKKFIAQYGNGFVRYATNGAAEALLLQKFKPAFSDDLKFMVFARGKDIWRADIDWKEFKLVNEKKVTAIEQFHEATFAENIMLGTDKTLIVRNVMKLLRVNLETGDVKPVRMNINGIRKHRSPDGKSLVGFENGKFYCYDVDSDDAKIIPVGGRGVMNDYQWVGDDRCVAIASMKTVVLYDRLKNTLIEVTALPFLCVKIGEPSPDNRFVFCGGKGKGAVIDLEKKTATPVAGGTGMCWVSNNTYAFSREVPDSDLRGSWLQTVGEGERRVSTEPFLVSKKGAELMALPDTDLVIFATKHALSKMKADGTDLAVLVRLPHPPVLVTGIQKWKTE
jgi:hypothetical protein